MSRSILLLTHRAYAEPGNGAARSVQTMMDWLAAEGWSARAVTSGRIEQAQKLTIGAHHDALGLSRRAGEARLVASGRVGAVDLSAVETLPDAAGPDAAGEAQLTRLALHAIAAHRPDVVLTYGQDPCLDSALAAARFGGAQVVCTLRGWGYDDRARFAHVDRVLATSAYLAQRYHRSIGLHATALASPIDHAAVLAPDPCPEFVTFINPAFHKGVIAFASLAQRLGRERPDIPLLVVASGASAAPLATLPELARHPALLVCPPQDPRDLYAITRLLLVPSTTAEPFGRVAAEAMVNGIPPLVSDRGGLPETVGAGGTVLPLPAWLADKPDRLPTDAEMAPWFDAVIRLWDDAEAYARASAAARQGAITLYDEAEQRRRYVDYFTDPGPHPPLFA